MQAQTNNSTPTKVGTTPRPKSGRKPLQPLNCISTTATAYPTKPKQQRIEPTPQEYSSYKENNHPTTLEKTPVKEMESLDSSLADELSAIRKRMERLKIDSERTEKMLKEKDLVLDMKMKEMLQRGEVQKELEIEVDRLYRLKELKLWCMRVSPIKSLREKQQEKKYTKATTPVQEADDDDEREESVGENILGSPSFASSTIEETSDCFSASN